MAQLLLHPDVRCQAVDRIDVEVARPRPTTLQLSFVATGRIAGISLPPRKPSARVDELWRHTCFEAFIRPTRGSAYQEFNLAPSTEWAAYDFADYREGMASAAPSAAPVIEIESSPGTFTLNAVLELNLPTTDPWCLALSAVIEETNGNKSYWALKHPSAKPDFHHADSFALELPGPLRP